MLERKDAIDVLTKKYHAKRVNKAHVIIFTFPNGKQVAAENSEAEKQKQTFSLVVDSYPAQDNLKLEPKKYPKGGSRPNHNITRKDAPTLWWKDHDTWRIYPTSPKEFEAFLEWYLNKAGFDAESASESSNSTAYHLLDEDIDSASKTEYPLEDIQQRAIKTRRGQPDFRKRLLAAYNNKCVFTGCGVVSVLEAAHIIPHADGTDWETHNGLLLRADIHTLFDLKLLAVGDDYRIQLSRKLTGSDYDKLRGTLIRMPEAQSCIPSAENLAKHFEGFKELEASE